LQSPMETPDIASLLAATRAALAHLRIEELESLAAKAEKMLSFALSEQPLSHISPRCGAPAFNTGIMSEHRMLGDLLGATGENLRVLRRAGGDAEGSARWAR